MSCSSKTQKAIVAQGSKTERRKERYLLSTEALFMNSSISSFEGGSATTGSAFEAPLGTQEIAEIIVPLQARPLQQKLRTEELAQVIDILRNRMETKKKNKTFM